MEQTRSNPGRTARARGLWPLATLALMAGCGSHVDAAEDPTTGEAVTEETADAPPERAPRHRRHPIPPEAIAACEESEDGAACEVTLPARSIDGTCVAGPEGETLACVPKDAPPRPEPPLSEPPSAERPPGARPPAGRPPAAPPEALVACEERSASEACTVELTARTLRGTCRRPPDPEAPLACAPERAPDGAAPPGGEPPPPPPR